MFGLSRLWPETGDTGDHPQFSVCRVQGDVSDYGVGPGRSMPAVSAGRVAPNQRKTNKLARTPDRSPAPKSSALPDLPFQTLSPAAVWFAFQTRNNTSAADLIWAGLYDNPHSDCFRSYEQGYQKRPKNCAQHCFYFAAPE